MFLNDNFSCYSNIILRSREVSNLGKLKDSVPKWCDTNRQPDVDMRSNRKRYYRWNMDGIWTRELSAAARGAEFVRSVSKRRRRTTGLEETGIFNRLIGGAFASSVEKSAAPVFQTYQPKFLFNVRRFIISLNFWTLNYVADTIFI